MPSENDDDDMDDKWPARKNPALLAGAELVQNDEQAFIPPYWVKPYDCPHCHSKHVGVCVALTAGVCSSNKTSNVVLSLEKENTELVIDMRLPRYLTKHKNVSNQLVGTYRLRVLPVPATLANQIDSCGYNSCGYDSCGFKGMTQYAIKDIIGHKGKNQ